jgi:hypothetical protein
MNFVDIAYNLLTGLQGTRSSFFVHELGHFLAARSRRRAWKPFRSGFGQLACSDSSAATRTGRSACLIPLGGFVKMAGEQIATPDAPSHSAAPDESDRNCSMTLVQLRIANEYHSCCGLSGIMYAIELVEGKNRPRQLPPPKYNEHGKDFQACCYV